MSCNFSGASLISCDHLVMDTSQMTIGDPPSSMCLASSYLIIPAVNNLKTRS